MKLTMWRGEMLLFLIRTRSSGIVSTEAGTLLRACLHGGGGPQVGEVTRLAVVKK